MNSSDINTQDYINPQVDSERMRRSRPATARTSEERRTRRRPVPDPDGPRKPQRIKNPTQCLSFAITARTLLSASFCVCLDL